MFYSSYGIYDDIYHTTRFNCAAPEYWSIYVTTLHKIFHQLMNGRWTSKGDTRYRCQQWMWSTNSSSTAAVPFLAADCSYLLCLRSFNLGCHSLTRKIWNSAAASTEHSVRSRSVTSYLNFFNSSAAVYSDTYNGMGPFQWTHLRSHWHYTLYTRYCQTRTRSIIINVRFTIKRMGYYLVLLPGRLKAEDLCTQRRNLLQVQLSTFGGGHTINGNHSRHWPN